MFGCRTQPGYSACEGCHQPRGGVQPRRLRIFKYQELATATNSFSERNILGKGSHSCVYKAVLNDGQVVAVKRPSHGRRTLQEAISFTNELEILSKLRYRHLVNLVGFCNDEKLLVVEYMENGTLYDVLHCSKEPLSWSTRIYMALQAAKAILALHSALPPIIHRDVKSSNILIDRYWNAKLSDLGLALRGPLADVASKDTPPAGTMGYIDPAYETPSQISSKSDVFSFGILLLEIMSGRKAIDVRFEPPSLLDWAVPLIRGGKSLDVCDKSLEPPQDLQVVNELAAIAARAVRESKDKRPTMAEVVEGLQKLRQKLPSPRFGGKPLWAPRIAVRKGEVGEDSVSVSTEGSPAMSFSPVTKSRKDEVSWEDSGESVPSSPSIGNEVVRAPARVVRQNSGQGVPFAHWDAFSIRDAGRMGPPSYISCSSSVQQDKLVHEDPGERVSFSKWSTSSIRSVSGELKSTHVTDLEQSSSSLAYMVAREDADELLSSSKWGTSSIRSVSGEFKSTSAPDLEQSSRSQGYKSRSGDCRFVDSNGDRLVSTTRPTTRTFSSAVTRAAINSKPASTPIFDPTSAHGVIGSPLRVDMIRDLACSSQVAPLSFWPPGLSAINSVVDRSTITRRPLETPTFGSKGSLRTVDPSLAARGAAPGLATLGTNSQFRPSDGRGSGIHDFSERKSKLAMRDVLTSQRSLQDRSSVETLQRTSSLRPHVQLAPQRSLREGSGRYLNPEQNRCITETRERISSKPHSQLVSQRSLREESGRHLTPEQNRSTTETQQRAALKPNLQLVSQRSLREGSGRHFTPEQNRNTAETQQRTSSMHNVQVGSRSSLLEGSSGQVHEKTDTKGPTGRPKLSSFFSQSDEEKLSSLQRSRREGSSDLVPSKRNSKDTSERQLPPFSSKPLAQKLASSQRVTAAEGISSQVPRKMNKDSRETQLLKSSSRAHVQLESHRPLPEWSSRVVPKRKSKDSRETQHLSSFSSKLLPRESGRGATQKGTSHRGPVVSNGGSIVLPTVSFRMDMVVPIWDIPEPAGKFYTNSQSHFKEVDLPIAV